MEEEQREDWSRKHQAFVLSWEFWLAVIVNLGGFVYFATMSQASQDARISQLESQQVTDARISRMEEQLKTVVENQKELKDIAKDLQKDLNDERNAHK